jgi:hydrogenase maturation protease
MKKILILGIGNLLMGDEGIGIHAVKALEKKILHDEIDLLDGGTGGFHLMSYFQEYENIIMIDASLDKKPAGTVSVVQPKFASDFPKALSSHDIGLKDLLEAVALLDKLPKIYLITISIKDLNNMSLELSPVVLEAIPQIIKDVDLILEKFIL